MTSQDNDQMTAVRVFQPTNRLTKMVRLPGGKPVELALRDAQAAVERYRPEVVQDIDGWIAELEGLAAQPGLPQAARDRVYRVASSILEHAGLFNLKDVGQAAYSLCDLVDRLNDAGRWDAPAVAVHVGSIRLLREMGEAPPEHRAKLIAGLHAVVAKIAAEIAGPA